MKKSELVNQISRKLQKSENLLKGYANGNVSLKQLCDNLTLRVFTEIEKAGMLPPEVTPVPQNIIDDCLSSNYWEPEDD